MSQPAADTEDDAASPAVRLETATLAGLSRRSLFPWLADAVLDWLWIAGVVALFGAWPNALTLLASILIVGNRQHALAVLGHDGAHFTVSRQRAVNDLLTNLLCLWPLGLTVGGYRRLHFAHHRHTGTDRDPELAHKRLKAPEWDLPARPANILVHALGDLLGGAVRDFIILVRFSAPERKRDRAPVAVLHLAASAALVAAGLGWAVFVWYFSLAASFMMFFRLRLWLEHQGTDGTLRVALNPWQAALLAPHNAFCHWEHHAYPTIPYHRLPAARRLLAGEPVLGLAALGRRFRKSAAVASGAALAGSGEAPA